MLGEELSLHEPLPNDYAGGEEAEIGENYIDAMPQKDKIVSVEKPKLVPQLAAAEISNLQSRKNHRHRREKKSN